MSENFLAHSLYGFQGAFEGEAFSQERILDSDLPPSRRDLIRDQDFILSKFYFSEKNGAEAARKEILNQLGDQIEIQLEEIPFEDWNKKWREAFTGVDVSPYWSIVPLWNAERSVPSGHQKIVMNPSLGFGTGEHSTTQLCLAALGELSLEGKKVLDFGAGSGILSVAAALKGADVISIEIDEMALQSAQDCAEMNGVSDKIKFFQFLPENFSSLAPFDLVVANILKNVLIEFSSTLSKSLAPHGDLILSGLLENDLKEVQDVYQSYFDPRRKFSATNLKEWWRLRLEQ
ncbi:MAG: 50S ribosomal protein L11 methyltransferase [Deltaproteobacteria bacterium]|nr:50S ribosomal protein L11 methyltransferase [Deltaproteobacteria bacterium]